MSCNLTLTIGDAQITVAHEQPLLSNADLLPILQASGKWPQILEAIQKRVKNKVGTYEEVNIDDLVKEDGLVPNTNIAFMQAQFPEVEFPDVDVPILLLDNLTIGGKKHFGRYTLANDSVLYIVKNNEYNINQLANFLKLQEAVDNALVNFSESSTEQQILNKIKEKKGFKTINELLLDFSINKDKYNKIKVVHNDKTIFAYSYLDEISRTILELSPKKVYINDFVTNISRLFKYRKDKQKKSYKIELNIGLLYSQLKEYHGDLLKALDLKSVDAFKSFMGKPIKETREELEKLLTVNKDHINGYDVIIYNLLNKVDNSFNYFLTKTSGVNLEFKSSPRTIEDKYGVAYETINAMEIVDTNAKNSGYKIFKQKEEDKVYYYPTRYYLTESSITNRFETKEEAEKDILEHIKQQDLVTHTTINITLGKNKSNMYIPVGTIMEVLDLDIDKNSDIIVGSQLFKTGNTYKDFEKLINSFSITEVLKERIKKYIVNPDQVFGFLYELGKYSEVTPESVNAAIDAIRYANKKYYYVEKVKKAAEDDNGNIYEYTLIETQPNRLETYRKRKNYPVRRLLSTMQHVFGEKHNIQVNLLNSDEIQEQFQDIQGNVKAFIRDGNIYINMDAATSQDLLHEYIHLLLGALKTNPNTRKAYEDLLFMFANTKDGDNAIKYIRDSYPNISEMDLREEAFAKKFSNYLRGKMTNDALFVENSKYRKGTLSDNSNKILDLVKEGTRTIFDLEGSYDLRDIYNKSIQEIFGRFSYDISNKLKEDTGLDFSSTLETRKKTNWINAKIASNEIKEDCNG